MSLGKIFFPLNQSRARELGLNVLTWKLLRKPSVLESVPKRTGIGHTIQVSTVAVTGEKGITFESVRNDF